MHDTVGKLDKSSFQRYQFCVNRSSNGEVMVPGSRGVRVVFLHFFGEDSGQTRDDDGKPRVARCS